MLNTTPEGDLEAFADYGGPSKSCPPAAAIVKRSWTSLPRPETTFGTPATQLQDEAGKSFVASWNELMAVLTSKCDAMQRAE